MNSNKNFTKTLNTDSRLEYQYLDGNRTSELELQFINYLDSVEHGDCIDFNLARKSNGHQVIVPTVLRCANLGSLSSEKYLFRVKSLEFAIATWALRITGFAINQKRGIRQPDIDNFARLVETSHDTDSVKLSIDQHPQNPRSLQSDKILSKALLLIMKDLNNG